MQASIKFKSNIDALIIYIDVLMSNIFAHEIKFQFENGQEIRKLEKRAKDIVKRLVYAVYEPEKYKRTYRLLQSITVSSGNNEADIIAGIVLFADPSVSGAKIGSSDESYAAFFERPEEFNTFIHPRGQAQEPENFRPFFNKFKELMQEFVDRHGKKSIHRAIKSLQPKEVAYYG